MKRSLVLLLMLLSLGLASCLPETTATPTLTPTTRPTLVAQATPTAGLTVPTGTEFLPASGCTAITKKPTPGATPETIYPPITAADHVKGPASAKVTIIEYSDFQ